MALRVIGDLFADVHGDESPSVIALHGWGRRGSDFADVLRGVNAVAFDLPGFGATPAPTHVLSTSDVATMVAESLDSIGVEGVVVIGHSYGGRVAVRLAAERPDLVGRLILTGVPLVRTRHVSRPSRGYRVIRLGHRLGIISDERMEALRRRRGSADYRAASGVMRDVMVATVNETYDDDLGRVRCPVDLVWGALDRDVPIAAAQEIARVLGESGQEVNLSVIESVGHLLPVESPAALRALLEIELT